MKRLGKHLGLIFGVGVLVSAMPVWAQPGTAPSTAKQQADEAIDRARVEESQKAVQQYLKALKLPIIQNTWSAGTNVQWNSGRSTDPLATLQVAPGTWWNNADAATRLGLTKEQQKKMDDIFQQFRLKLIDLNAALSKEELILDPLIASDKLDEIKILTQIDRIALARAELEKANSRMLLGIRQSLTMEQWTRIQASPTTYRMVQPKK